MKLNCLMMTALLQFMLWSIEGKKIISACHHATIRSPSALGFVSAATKVNLTGLILARGGSKGIPLKNLAYFKGKTLLHRAILTMKKFGQFSSIWVSTDHVAIAQEAERLGVFVHWRSKETATDTASSLLAVQEFCSRKPGVSYIGLVQCTSPFLSSSILEGAYELINHGYDSVFTVTRAHKLVWREMPNGEITPVNFDRQRRPRRQEWKGDLVENGMLYFTNIDNVNSGLLQGGRLSIRSYSNSLYNDRFMHDCVCRGASNLQHRN